VNAILKFLKSIKLAVGLISCITLASILATLVPQGRDAAFYMNNYPEVLSRFILLSGFNNFFKSLLFFVPSLLFFVNLLVCSVDRLTRELAGRARKRFGPDILHLGLLVLIVGALASFLGRQENTVFMGEGDSVKIDGRYSVVLKSFRSLAYPDGRPKDWISTVDVADRDGTLLASGNPIEVNSPLNVAGFSVYQVSFSREKRVLLRDPDGNPVSLAAGEVLQIGQDSYRVADITAEENGEGGASATLEKWVGHKVESTRVVGKSDKLGNYEVLDIGYRDLTGLKFVRDPGALIVIVSLIVCGIGLCLTFIRKIGDENT
jgi:hypothetical protein